jgi:hypothetical protein
MCNLTFCIYYKLKTAISTHMPEIKVKAIVTLIYKELKTAISTHMPEIKVKANVMLIYKEYFWGKIFQVSFMKNLYSLDEEFTIFKSAAQA